MKKDSCWLSFFSAKSALNYRKICDSWNILEFFYIVSPSGAVLMYIICDAYHFLQTGR